MSDAKGGTEDGFEEFRQLSEVAELRKVIQKQQDDLRKAKATKAQLVQAAHDGAHDANLILGTAPAVPKPRKDRRPTKPEVALLHLSDWQLGKKTDSYNTEVALKRVEEIGEKLITMTEIERKAHPVHVCHTMLGGDMGEGTTIFPGQQHEIDSGMFEQAFNCIGAIERLARLQLANFQKVVMWEVDGNHGRIGKKGENLREDNMDLFVYAEARERLKDFEKSGRLAWNKRQRFYQIVEIGTYKALLIHGDQIKQFGGNTPAFGISRKVNSWAAGVVPEFHDCYLGHFHQPLVLPLSVGRRRTFMNPSLESDSAYAQEFLAAVGSPAQRLNFVNPIKGEVTTERLLWVQ